MKYTQGEIKRVFILRLEDKDKLPKVIEDFAKDHSISNGICILVGGIEDKGRIVVGPEEGSSSPPVPMILQLKGVHEICAVGTIFTNEEGRPTLHMHAALGRGEETKTGCIRPGLEVWKIGEVIIFEIIGGKAVRKKDPSTGFEMLEIEDMHFKRERRNC